LSEDLPVFEPGQDVFDAGPDPTVRPVVLVVDDGARVVTSGGGDGGDAAVAPVAEDFVAGEKVRDGCAGDDDVVAVAGPAAAHGNDPAGVGADDDLGVDAAPIVLADRGDRLIVYRDEGAVDDPRSVLAGGGVAERRPVSVPGDEGRGRWWTGWCATGRPAPWW
jgi:hypothetical protein